MTASPQPRPKVPRSVGALSGHFVLTLVVFAVVGLGWGWWRPLMTGTVTEERSVAITDPLVLNGNLEFATFGVMVACFIVLGIALAIYSALKYRQNLGLGHLLWGALSTLIGEIVFFYIGTQFALSRVGVNDPEHLQVGSTVEYLPSVDMGIAILVAPVTFLITLWCAAVFQPDDHTSSGGTDAASGSERANVSG